MLTSESSLKNNCEQENRWSAFKWEPIKELINLDRTLATRDTCKDSADDTSTSSRPSFWSIAPSNVNHEINCREIQQLSLPSLVSLYLLYFRVTQSCQSQLSILSFFTLSFYVSLSSDLCYDLMCSPLTSPDILSWHGYLTCCCHDDNREHTEATSLLYQQPYRQMTYTYYIMLV